MFASAAKLHAGTGSENGENMYQTQNYEQISDLQRAQNDSQTSLFQIQSGEDTPSGAHAPSGPFRATVAVPQIIDSDANSYT